MRRFRFVSLVAMAVLALFLPALALAQAITAPPAPQAFDWTAVAINLVTGLQVLLVPMAVAGVRKGLPRLPRVSIPFLAVVLGVLSDAVATWVAGGGFSPLRGVLVGLASVALREVTNTIREHGTS